MLGYVIGHVDITDPEGFEEYSSQVPPTIEQYGGRFITRGGRAEKLEGSIEPWRLVILEFPSYEQAKAWYQSDEYQPLIEMRQRTSIGDLLLVEGYEG